MHLLHLSLTLDPKKPYTSLSVPVLYLIVHNCGKKGECNPPLYNLDGAN